MPTDRYSEAMRERVTVAWGALRDARALASHEGHTLDQGAFEALLVVLEKVLGKVPG